MNRIKPGDIVYCEKAIKDIKRGGKYFCRIEILPFSCRNFWIGGSDFFTMRDFLRYIAFKLLLDSTQNRHNQFDMLQPTQEMNQYVNSEVKHLNIKGYCHGTPSQS